MGAHPGMGGQGGEALDQALGLLRAPGLRGALRQRPLPQGIGELLAIASGSSDVTRVAATRTGSPDAELVEASRFYVQQVLLADDTDAYRALGAAPDADQAVLRDHHRLLLRWLHPDRSEGAQWDSALSTRVNQAWNQLRTPAARARYDADHAPTAHAGAATPVGTATAAIPGSPYTRHLAAPTPIPTGPIAVAFLTIACLALAWLAITREGRLDAQRYAGRFHAQDIDLAQRMAAPLPQVLPEVDVRAPAPLPVIAPKAPQLPELAEFSELSERSEPSPQGWPDPSPPDWPESSPTDWPDPSPGDWPDPDTSTVGAATAAIQPGRESRPYAEPAAPRIAAIAAPAGEGARSAQLIAAVAAPAADPGQLGEAEDPLQLFHEAEAALRGVTAWFSGERGAEPLWLDLRTSERAEAARARLQARHAMDPRASMHFDHPSWTLGSRVASVSGAYRLDGRHGTVETGLLRLELARRGPHWRVAALHLEPAR